MVDLGEFKIPQKEHRHEPGKTEGQITDPLTKEESELIRLRCKIILKHKLKHPKHKFKVKLGDSIKGQGSKTEKEKKYP